MNTEIFQNNSKIAKKENLKMRKETELNVILKDNKTNGKEIKNIEAQLKKEIISIQTNVFAHVWLLLICVNIIN